MEKVTAVLILNAVQTLSLRTKPVYYEINSASIFLFKVFLDVK